MPQTDGPTNGQTDTAAQSMMPPSLRGRRHIKGYVNACNLCRCPDNDDNNNKRLVLQTLFGTVGKVSH